MTEMSDDPIEQLAALSDANVALAEEIQALLAQAIAEAALDKAAVKTRALVDNVTKARAVVQALQTKPAAEAT